MRRTNWSSERSGVTTGLVDSGDRGVGVLWGRYLFLPAPGTPGSVSKYPVNKTRPERQREENLQGCRTPPSSFLRLVPWYS